MPFTVSHVAAVLPVVARRHTARSVPAAWVIGSMVPDLPWFFAGGRGAAFTHSLTGLVTADVALGLALFTLWRGVLFAPVRDLLPPVIGLRLPSPVTLRRTRWGWACLGVLLGATTHLVWDDFTHEGRWAVARIGWLHTEHAGLLGAQWAQLASGVVGGALVLVVCGRLLVTARRDLTRARCHLSRARCRRRRGGRQPRRWWPRGWSERPTVPCRLVPTASRSCCSVQSPAVGPWRLA